MLENIINDLIKDFKNWGMNLLDNPLSCTKKKIAIDIHGVLDANPLHFINIALETIKYGGEVHILTGSEWSKRLEDDLKVFFLEACKEANLEIPYTQYWTHFASIITILKESNAPMYWNESRGHWCVNDNETWDKVKGDYCREHQIDELYDDTIEYRKYMPSFTKFFLYSHDPVAHEEKLKKKKHYD